MFSVFSFQFCCKSCVFSLSCKGCVFSWKLAPAAVVHSCLPLPSCVWTMETKCFNAFLQLEPLFILWCDTDLACKFSGNQPFWSVVWALAYLWPFSKLPPKEGKMFTRGRIGRRFCLDPKSCSLAWMGVAGPRVNCDKWVSHCLLHAPPLACFDNSQHKCQNQNRGYRDYAINKWLEVQSLKGFCVRRPSSTTKETVKLGILSWRGARWETNKNIARGDTSQAIF